jgi:hypothetical protein
MVMRLEPLSSRHVMPLYRHCSSLQTTHTYFPASGRVVSSTDRGIEGPEAKHCRAKGRVFYDDEPTMVYFATTKPKPPSPRNHIHRVFFLYCPLNYRIEKVFPSLRFKSGAYSNEGIYTELIFEGVSNL